MFVPVHVKQAHGGAELQLHSYLNPAVNESEWLASQSALYTPGKGCQYSWNSGLGGFRAPLHTSK